MADEFHKRKLIEHYVAGQATEQELQAFFGLLATAELDALIEAHMDREITAIRQAPKKRGYRLALAASVLLLLSAGGYLALRQPAPVTTQALNFAPGGNKAVLTLAGGKQIVLTGVRNGQLAKQGSATITKAADGQLVYRSGGEAAPAYNTLTTPRGGQYHLTLADGTGVWLNAASSISYPVAFTGKERRVSITGEAYFEVAHDAARPFRVTSNGQAVEVLGTHFNINSYANEPGARTTLLEGSIRLTAGGNQQILRPGQQATVNSGLISLSTADVGEATAWKDGYFEFSNADIQTVMRQLSRWYAVDIEFSGPATTETFTGRISRFRNISQVLKIVEASNSVHITVQGRRIMVSQ